MAKTWFTIKEFAHKSGLNAKYVQQCCIGWQNPKTGWRCRLPSGWVARKLESGPSNRGMWVVCEAGREQDADEAATAPEMLQLLDLNFDVRRMGRLLSFLRKCYTAAIKNASPVTIELRFAADGSWTSTNDLFGSATLSTDENDSMKQLFLATWTAAIANKKTASVENAGDQYINNVWMRSPFMQSHPRRLEWERRCICCGRVKNTKRKQARFCQPPQGNCRVDFSKWLTRMVQLDEGPLQLELNSRIERLVDSVDPSVFEK